MNERIDNIYLDLITKLPSSNGLQRDVILIFKNSLFVSWKILCRVRFSHKLANDRDKYERTAFSGSENNK